MNARLWRAPQGSRSIAAADLGMLLPSGRVPLGGSPLPKAEVELVEGLRAGVTERISTESPYCAMTSFLACPAEFALTVT